VSRTTPPGLTARESASVGGDIRPFAAFIAERVRWSADKRLHAQHDHVELVVQAQYGDKSCARHHG